MENQFWISESECRNQYAIATYLIESPLKPEEALIKIAKEQSLSNWSGNPNKEQKIIKAYSAKGVTGSIKVFTINKAPSLSTNLALPNKAYYVFTAKIAFPIINFGGMLATMYNTIVGEIHNIGVLTGIKVLDIKFPEPYLRNFRGPRFGILGIRKILEEPVSPIFIGPVKPCVGLTPREFGKTAYEVLKGGFHIVKDDELIVETSYSRFKDRVRETVKWVRKAEDETGRRKMYFAHIGGDSDAISKLFEIAVKADVDGIMLSPAINGLDIANRFRGKLPIITHNTLMYASSRHPSLGVKFSLWSKLQRIAGADIMLTPAKFGSFDIMDEKEYLDNVETCWENLFQYRTIFPAFSGSQSPISLELHFRTLKKSDFIIVSGAAAYGHPMGGTAGAKSFVQAWTAVSSGITLSNYAKTREELRVSMETFGKDLIHLIEHKNRNGN
ncbi:MAG: hypothetical protein KJ879_00560 [Nanoarchaeota archaeon]|nr:hypothetical protein [Nanoarchaeota archaeon]